MKLPTGSLNIVYKDYASVMHIFDRLIGPFLIASALGHVVVGIGLYHPQLDAIWHDGVVNAVFAHHDRMAAVWFLLFTPVLLVGGLITNRAIQLGDSRLLKVLAWNFLGIGVVGVVLLPLSGLWTAIGVAPLLLKAASRVQPQESFAGSPATERCPWLIPAEPQSKGSRSRFLTTN